MYVRATVINIVIIIIIINIIAIVINDVSAENDIKPECPRPLFDPPVNSGSASAATITTRAPQVQTEGMTIGGVVRRPTPNAAVDRVRPELGVRLSADNVESLAVGKTVEKLVNTVHTRVENDSRGPGTLCLSAGAGAGRSRRTE